MFICRINKDNPISSYRHLLNLTKDYKEFQSAITNISKHIRNKSETNSKPTGGFDALAQAMVCTDEIGWRKDSRKIIIYISDALFRIAGDGKAAGITQPYDGKCYTKNGTYTKELEMDFPSIGIIRKLAADSDMTIIFVVQQLIIEKYQQLIKPIRGSELKYFKEFLVGIQMSADFEGGIKNTLSDIYEVKAIFFQDFLNIVIKILQNFLNNLTNKQKNFHNNTFKEKFKIIIVKYI